MATIGMLYICTGKYTVFWPEFYETFSRNFLPGCKKEYFIFTDAPSIAHEDDPAVHRIDQPAYDWPLSTIHQMMAIFDMPYVDNRIAVMNLLGNFVAFMPFSFSI